MQQTQGKPGIYLNPSRRVALRASTRFAAPTQPGWELISDDTMIGMVTIREIARERGLLSAEDAESIQWTGRADD